MNPASTSSIESQCNVPHKTTLRWPPLVYSPVGFCSLFLCCGHLLRFPPVSSNFIGTEEDHEEDEGDDGEGEGVEGGETAATGSTYLTKPLSFAGVRIDHGALLAVEDQQQKLSVQIRIVQRAQWDEEKEPDGFLLLQGKGASAAVTSAAAANSNAEDAATPVAALMEESKEAPAAPAASSAAPVSAASASTSHKRKQPSSADTDVIDADVTEGVDGPAAKRAKGASGAPVAAPAVAADADVIELD